MLGWQLVLPKWTEIPIAGLHQSSGDVLAKHRLPPSLPLNDRTQKLQY
ncbi:MAG: hypothetical protein LBF88_06180 [Planctomycetaceae bacterium]|nr:hypothetical protein [Planctomycetaceae bacterium]